MTTNREAWWQPLTLTRRKVVLAMLLSVWVVIQVELVTGFSRYLFVSSSTGVTIISPATLTAHGYGQLTALYGSPPFFLLTIVTLVLSFYGIYCIYSRYETRHSMLRPRRAWHPHKVFTTACPWLHTACSRVSRPFANYAVSHVRSKLWHQASPPYYTHRLQVGSWSTSTPLGCSPVVGWRPLSCSRSGISSCPRGLKARKKRRKVALLALLRRAAYLSPSLRICLPFRVYRLLSDYLHGRRKLPGMRLLGGSSATRCNRQTLLMSLGR